MEKCKFCEAPVYKTPIHERDSAKIGCPNCGIYEITWEAEIEPLDTSIEDRKLFSSFIRSHSTQNNPLHITTHVLKEIPNLILPISNFGPDDKIDSIIKYIVVNTKKIGQPINLVGNNLYPLFYCHDDSELGTLLDWMEALGLVKWYSKGYSVILEIEGWRRYEKLREKTIFSKKIFVAMNFDTALDNIFFNAIQPACAECGFIAVRVDLVEHNEKICDKIIAEIKESRFLIADFTGQKHGVYFEAGFAEGLGLKVIKTCKKGEEDKLHFDTRQYNHIIWENPQDLKMKLINRIKATVK